jgi:hypothetical protein
MDEHKDDPDTAVVRLETALERIALLAAHPAIPVIHYDPADKTGVPTEEIASRLDELIDRLRAALSNRPG